LAKARASKSRHLSTNFPRGGKFSAARVRKNESFARARRIGKALWTPGMDIEGAMS
jgi:hypothetical protein